MATYDWPQELGAPKSLDFQLVQTTVHARSMFGFHGQTVDLVNERWTTRLEIDIRDAAAGAKYEAFLASLRKGSNSVRLPRFDRLLPEGSLKTCAGVFSTAKQGANELVLFAPLDTTLLAGDCVEVSGQFFEVAEDCVSDEYGKITVKTINRVKRELSGILRDSVAYEASGLGVLSQKASDVVRYSYTSSKNLYYGTRKLQVGTGVYGSAVIYLKSGASNPRNLQPGQQLTVSGKVWRDDLAAADGAVARLFVFCTNSSGTWTTTTNLTGSTLNPTYLSAVLTLPVEASMFNVGVALYHRSGAVNYIGEVFADDIQVEFGSSPTAYESGIQPLLEPARTNFYLQSNVFTAANWAKTNCTVSYDSATFGPSGQAGCYKLAESTTTSSPHYIGQSFATVENSDYVYSAIVKAAERTSVWIETVNKNNVAAVWSVDLVTGATTTPAGQTPAVVQFLANGWVRISVKRNTSAGAANNARFNLFLTAAYGGSPTYAGTVGSGILLWGVMVEQGSAPTSHILTTTSVSTREADVISTSVNLTSPALAFKLVSKGAVTYGVGGVMQAMELDFEEAPL